MLPGAILDAATELFLRDGFGATSMEAVAASARVSKRTLYARFPEKTALLQAVVARLIQRWASPADLAPRPFDPADNVVAALRHLGRRILDTALSPQALALHRLVIAEAGRLPDLPRLLRDAGAGIGIAQLAAILHAAGAPDPLWAAEQFQTLIVTGPQRRALGLGARLAAPQLADWVDRCVALILSGLTAPLDHKP